MNKKPRSAEPKRAFSFAPMFLACAATLLGLPVHAAVEIPQVPLQTSNGVPPNIWFILDDSGSMEYLAMPEDVDGSLSDSPRYRGSARNTIYYNPSIVYRGWRNADGSYMADTPATKAYSDQSLASGSTNLTNNDQTFYVLNTGATDLTANSSYTKYVLRSGGTTAQKCTYSFFWNCTAITEFPWSRDIAAEWKNYANWYSYHRTRMKVAKAGASYAFNDETIFNKDNSYRVGFTTIWDNDTYRIPVGTNNGLFTGANRTTWFERLFGAEGSGRTPLIPALTRAGDYFGEVGIDGPYGPQEKASQYQCRQNFTILTTDGYWNNGSTSVGNVDGKDGSEIKGPNGASYTYKAATPYKDGTDNTLADVAMYYWSKDLREDLLNIVPVSAPNPAFWQHMVTFGISIGLRGTLDPKTDLAAIKAGTKSWPNPMDTEDQERIDDLWHATVNGHGEFVSAGNPSEFAAGLRNALQAIAGRLGSGSNVSVTSTSISSDTRLFQARYTGAQWTGELLAYPVTASGIGTTPSWSASIPVPASRKVFTYSGNAATPGTTFPTAAQTTALTADVVDYLKGDRSKEASNGGTLRNRVNLLGDIINSSPVYVKGDSAAIETVYVGANDGMLHAFNAATGEERFAYVPSGVNLTKLKEFSAPGYPHHFFVDGPIVVSTKAQTPNKNILVGTLGRGGKGLYALDVTVPTTFSATKVLWDNNGASLANMGYVLGKPFIAQLNNGKTGLIVPNGINSTSEKAVLFVFDLTTGEKIAEIDTGAGSAASSNGLSTPRGWDADGNGTVDTVYAGDLLGNVWKFDLSATNEKSWSVGSKPFYAPTAGISQPITGGISLGIDPATYKLWVFFGTGRMLTKDDLASTNVQSWYGIRDDGGTDSVVRADLAAREIVVAGTVNGAPVRGFEKPSALANTKKGWYIDLDSPPDNTKEGERMIGDPQLIANVLLAASIIPNSKNPCLPGRGYINALDAFTGASLSSSFFDANNSGGFDDDNLNLPNGGGQTPIGSIDLNVGMVTDPSIIQKLLTAGGSSGSTGSVPVQNPVAPGRISWRELFGD